jgi:hypothetical protein
MSLPFHVAAEPQPKKITPSIPEAVKKWGKLGFSKKIPYDFKWPILKILIFSHLPSSKGKE